MRERWKTGSYRRGVKREKSRWRNFYFDIERAQAQASKVEREGQREGHEERERERERVENQEGQRGTGR